MPPAKSLLRRKIYGVDLDGRQTEPYKPHIHVPPPPKQDVEVKKNDKFQKDYMDLDEFLFQVNDEVDESGDSANIDETSRMKPNVDLLASLLTLGKMIQDQKLLIQKQKAQEKHHQDTPKEKDESSVQMESTCIDSNSVKNNIELSPEPSSSYLKVVKACKQSSDLKNAVRKEGKNRINRNECPPSSSSWSESEQSLCSKSKRGLIPETIKDVDYWDRRKRNNLAAKKSREERRRKELEILKVTKQLESENSQLTTMLKRLTARNELLESRIQEIRQRHLHNNSSSSSAVASSSSAEDT